jgi:polysaccharide biosynthesis/export protein
MGLTGRKHVRTESNPSNNINLAFKKIYLMKYYLSIAIVFIFGFVSSCVTNKKLTYLQYTEPPGDTTLSVQPSDYKVQPFDNLFIKVVTPDPQWSDMFNTFKASTSGSSFTEQSADLISYAVDSEGNIELPYAGIFFVSGKTFKMVKTELEVVLKSYVTDASVTVKLINNYVNIIGEVNKPGRYPIYKDRLNIFQALAMAGDLGDFSNRQKVQIIRQIPGGNITKEFSLTDRNILSSEYFCVMPNDVIYAKPMEGRFFKMNEFPYGIVLSAITTFILFLNIVQ